VLTFNHPENKTPTRAAATIAPRTWTIPRRIARKRVTEPIILIPKVTYTIVSKKVRDFGFQGSRTAGLNNPPLILKKYPGIDGKRKTKARTDIQRLGRILLYYSRNDRVPVLVFEEMFATCVPAKAKNRKSIVPANSPMAATMWPLALGGAFSRSLLAHVL
jgi:hypothetical protein